MKPEEKLLHEVRSFLETYKVLPPASRASFEAILFKNLRNEDEQTKKLYQALIAAAKDNNTVEGAIAALNQAAGKPA
ncbi:MAG: hypothetical protein KKC80_00155 [Candidatus Margulisbacteria bacterium]|nr:hypothetical protein [Candidatus Margulisiibacteriota bacterium]MBU1617730.1 hypothetical protein [Candidatus Margulisiibacteriota bacterium]MBU1867471.1 hypothetical protein [Candidatus Margulisiibacteriota bacterium]